MATFTVRPEGIIRQPALTMPGNATGAEAACTSLTASQIRTLLSLGTTSDVTFDIVRATTSVQTPLVNNASAALTLGNSTHGVTVPGAATFSGDISMSKTSAQGYIRAYATDGVKNAALYHDGTNARLDSSSGDVYFGAASGLVYAYKAGVNSTIAVYNGSSGNRVLLDPTTVPSIRGQGNLWCIADSGAVVLQGSAGITQVLKSGTNAELRVYDSTTGKYSGLTHDGTNGILSTSSGNLNIVPTGGTVTVTGAATFSSTVTCAGITTSGPIRSTPDGTNNSLGVGTVDLYSAAGSPVGIVFAERNIANRGSLGFAAGSDNLDYRHGGGVLSSGGTLTGRFTSTEQFAVRGGIRSGQITDALTDSSYAGRLELFADYGSAPYIRWREFNKINSGVLGFAVDSTTLSYRSGAISMTTGTEVFTIGNTGNVGCAGITASGAVSHGAYTVATLPAAGSNAGKMAQVTDSNVAASGNYGATVAAGGANRVKVFSDGTNWVIA